MSFVQSPPQPLGPHLPGAPPLALDLIQQLMRYGPSQRLTATQALEHLYFKSLPVASTPADVSSRVAVISAAKKEDTMRHTSVPDGLCFPFSGEKAGEGLWGGGLGDQLGNEVIVGGSRGGGHDVERKSDGDDHGKEHGGTMRQHDGATPNNGERGGGGGKGGTPMVMTGGSAAPSWGSRTHCAVGAAALMERVEG